MSTPNTPAQDAARNAAEQATAELLAKKIFNVVAPRQDFSLGARLILVSLSAKSPMVAPPIAEWDKDNTLDGLHIHPLYRAELLRLREEINTWKSAEFCFSAAEHMTGEKVSWKEAFGQQCTWNAQTKVEMDQLTERLKEVTQEMDRMGCIIFACHEASILCHEQDAYVKTIYRITTDDFKVEINKKFSVRYAALIRTSIGVKLMEFREGELTHAEAIEEIISIINK